MSYDAKTGLMGFSDALASMKRGGKVSRPNWGPYWVAIVHRTQTVHGVAIDDDFIGINSLNPKSIGQLHQTELTTEDLLAEDWEEAVVPI